MKILVDTNILVSFFLGSGICTRVVHEVLAGEMRWLVTAEIEAEYRAVLSRGKLKLVEADVQEWFKEFDMAKEVLLSHVKVDFLRDPEDAKFLECAISADADYLISGDRDFESDQAFLPRTKIVTPKQFLALM